MSGRARQRPRRGAGATMGRGAGATTGGRADTTLGADDHSTLVRAYGLREIGTGIGILASDDPAPWVWGRVAGDLLDLATLAPTLARDNPQRGYAMAAFRNVAAVTALDVFCALALSARPEPRPPMRDYSDRSGLPRPPEQMRGTAREDRGLAGAEAALGGI